jgi:hypothetical protein
MRSVLKVEFFVSYPEGKESKNCKYVSEAFFTAHTETSYLQGKQLFFSVKPLDYSVGNLLINKHS